MKVLLFGTPLARTQVRLRRYFQGFPLLGLLYIAASLRKQGHQVLYREGNFTTLDEVISIIKEEQIDLVGIHCTIQMSHEAGETARRIRDACPSVFIAVGGPWVSSVGEMSLGTCAAWDAAVVGEGEEVICEMAAALEQGERPRNIRGCAMRKDGGIHTAGEKRIVEDLDKLPFPAWDLVNLDAYPKFSDGRLLRAAHIFSARGCANHCAFCMSDKTLRLRSIENFVEEIEMLARRHGVRSLYIYDDTFTLFKERVLAICEELQRRKLGVIFMLNARVDTVDAEILRELKRAGCWRIHYGIESGVQRNLDRVNKGTKLEQIRAAVRLTKEHGIRAYGFFVFGIPGETYSDGLETIRFMRSLKLDDVGIGYLTPYPGTELYRQAVEDNIGKLRSRCYSHRNVRRPSFVPDSITEAELQRLMVKALLTVHTRPDRILRNVMKLRFLPYIEFLCHFRHGFISR